MKADSTQWPALALVRGWPVSSQPRHPSLGPGAGSAESLGSGAAEAHRDQPLSQDRWRMNGGYPSLIWIGRPALGSNGPTSLGPGRSSVHPSIHSPSTKQGSCIPSPWGAATLGGERK